MTRLYLISSIAVGAILLQFLVSRPPEIEWIQPDSSAAESTVSATGNSELSPANIVMDTVDLSQQSPVIVGRKALQGFASLWDPELKNPQSSTRIHLKDGSSFDVHDAELLSGSLSITVSGDQKLQIPSERVNYFESVEFQAPAPIDPSLKLALRITAGEQISDAELRQWIESGEADAFVENYPHSTNRELHQLLNRNSSSTARKISNNNDPVDTEELDEWMANVRDLMTRNVSSTQRTELVLEMDQRLSRLNAQLTRSPENRTKITQFANRLRILKLDLIKSTGF